MAKVSKCIQCGKERVIYAKSMCQSCYWTQSRQKSAKKTRNKTPHSASEPLSRKSRGKIPLRSEKRSLQEKEYRDIIAIMKKKAAKHPCFFCGEPLGTEKQIDMHHLDGRENDNLTDISNLVAVHRECHLKYHNEPVRCIPWFLDYVNRLSDRDPVKAEREMFKYDK